MLRMVPSPSLATGRIKGSDQFDLAQPLQQIIVGGDRLREEVRMLGV